MAVRWGTDDEAERIVADEAIYVLPDMAANEVRSGVECFYCGDAVSFPVVAWHGETGVIYIHERCVCPFVASLMSDWKIIRDGREAWIKNRAHWHRLRQRLDDAEEAKRRYEATTAELSAVIDHERALRAQAEQERKALNQALLDVKAIPETIPVRLDPLRVFTKKQRQEIYRRADGNCQACARPLGPDWHADHIVPHSRGGRTEVINGQSLCGTCNNRKRAKVLTVDEG